jgi:imidazolonepropionase
MTPDEAILAATAGGAAALQRDDVGILRPGAAGDLIVLDATSPIDFVYRPGVPIVALTIVGGQVVHDAGRIRGVGR